tara:strand:- start:735 stop:1394 length:660 start_codon:yes stop_codon:yes gene_type:complete
MSNSAIELNNVSKSYSQGGKDICVLNDVNFEVREGELVSITGPSGSGKTTLLNIIALIDGLDLGNLHVFGDDLSNLNEKEKSIFRKNNFGFVYQSNNLFDDFNAIENVALPLILNGCNKNDAFNESENILKKFGLLERKTHFPNALSGGEQQRIAIARAVVNKPRIVIADEPTGNLDKENSLIIFDYLKNYADTEKLTVVMATHNNELANKCTKEIKLA